MTSTATQSPRLLNLGCGARCHPAWVNVDLQAHGPLVRAHDVTKPLPFADDEFDAVYHSHLLEHVPTEHALPFLRECRRVLKPGGILRVAVPDLEQIVRLYLAAFDGAAAGDAAARDRHRWLVLELYDQTTREHPGGAMLEFLRRAGSDSVAWQRIGADGITIRSHLARVPAPPPRPTLWQRLRGNWREKLLRRLLGAEYPLLQVTRFRRGGEIHRTMYDRVSLGELLAEAGFTRFACLTAADSAIPAWRDYGLDVGVDGGIAKPDSLFAEAVRP